MRKIRRFTTIIVGILVTISIIGATAMAHAGLLESLAEINHNSSSAAVAPQAAAAAALGKFSATGPVSETIANGACTGSLAASGTTCSTPGDCIQLQVSGVLKATAFGNANFAACITLDNSPVSKNLNACFDGLGTGTVTSANNKGSANLALAGLLCIADGFPLPTPSTVIFVMTGSYAVNGGTGSFAGAIGSGSANISAVVTNVTALPLSATGQANLAGTIAK